MTRRTKRSKGSRDMKRKRKKIENQLIEVRKRKMFLISQGMVPKKKAIR